MLEMADRREGRLHGPICSSRDRTRGERCAVPPQLAKAIAGTSPQGRPERAHFFVPRQSSRCRCDPRNPAYAETLRAIAERGGRRFYGGPIAQRSCRGDTTAIQHMSAMTCGLSRARTDTLAGPMVICGVQHGSADLRRHPWLPILGILGNSTWRATPNGDRPSTDRRSKPPCRRRPRPAMSPCRFRARPTAKCGSELLKRARQDTQRSTFGEARPGKFTDPRSWLRPPATARTGLHHIS